MSSVIPAFNNHLPVRIQFGDGVANQLADVAKQLQAQRALVIIDEGLEENNPGVAESLQTLQEAGLEPQRYVKAPGEPSTEVVDAVSAAVTASGADVVIAVGGGSVIDAAKAGRLCAQHGCAFKDLGALADRYPEPEIPLIAVPTTAGTGSEVSGGAVISDKAAGTKTGIANANLRPQYALVDPLLTHSLPAQMTAYTGIDALAQAMAGMIAKVRTPIGDAIALEAIRLGGRSLVTACREGADAAARSEMACASLMAGLTMNISDCTAEHSLGQAIGGMFGVPHGLTIGLVLAETLDRERAWAPEQLERIADALGVPADGSADGSRAVRGVQEILAALDFPVLGSVGVRESDLDQLTELAMADFFITQSPHPWSTAEVRTAFTAALAVTQR
ncbi:MAG: iron-containing alcohol dehydrogenase family protein [Solirubrobacteraceae bacterium]